jgi:DNA-binding CsgD family transcriptional regulator
MSGDLQDRDLPLEGAPDRVGGSPVASTGVAAAVPTGSGTGSARASGPGSGAASASAVADDGRRLLGRDADVAALGAALADVRAGTGRAIALVGEPGIGKSALMWTATARARAAGVPVHTAHVHTGQLRDANPASTGPSGSGSSSGSSGTGSGSSSGSSGTGSGSGSGERPHAGGASDQLTALAELATRATRTPRTPRITGTSRTPQGGPVVAAVDDLHQLSADGIPVVERLIEATASHPVLFLVAYRQRQLPPALAAVLARAASAGLLDVWNLGPLSQEQAQDLLGDHPDADAVYHAALGNPQYLKILAGRGEASVDAGLAVLGETAGLDPAALTVVQAAAVLGERFQPVLLAEVAGLEAVETLRALDLLTRLDLVRPAEPAPQLALRHPAVAEVVYQRLEPSRRIDLHQRAAAALARRTAPIARRAHHVARAADPSRPEHATTLIAAARDALYTSPAVAADYLQAALPLLRDGEAHRHEAQVLLARTLLLTGDASESRALLDALRSALPGGPPHQVTALADSSRIERRLGRYTEAGAIARSGLAALADSDTATAAALHSELSDYAYDVQDYEVAHQHADTAAAIARRHQDCVGEAHALAQAAVAHLFAVDQATALARVTRAADLIDATSDATLLTNLEASHQLGMVEGMLGRLADSERHLTRGAELSRRTGQTYIEPQILTTLANAQLRSGNLRGALVTLDATARHIERVGNPSTRAIIANVRAEVLFWLNGPDDLREVIALAEQAAAIAGDLPTAWAVSVRCFCAELLLQAGDTARAGRRLLEAAGGRELSRLTTWRRPRWCDALAQAASAEGDPASVEHWARLAEASLDLLPSVGRQGFAQRARMRAHAIRGDTEQALRSAQDAVVNFSAGGEHIESCRTLLAAASLALDAGRTRDVAGWLDRAADLAHRCDSARLADEVARIRDRLAACTGPAGAPPPDALAVLTAREREIAELASTGMTSGEIAELLFLSVRTVDSHLGRIYRKLDVSNRASLAHALLNGGPRNR